MIALTKMANRVLPKTVLREYLREAARKDVPGGKVLVSGRGLAEYQCQVERYAKDLARTVIMCMKHANRKTVLAPDIKLAGFY